MSAKDKWGRPTVMTPEVLLKLEHAFSIGCTDLEACVYADIGQSTLYAYQKDNHAFLERKHELKEKPMLKARSIIADKLNNNDPETARWYAERKKKSEFSTRQETTGADGLPPVIENKVTLTIVEAKAPDGPVSKPTDS